MDALACISKARTELAKATKLSAVVGVRNSAEAIRVYIKSAGESLQAQNAAADIRLQCERKAGELLAEREGAKTGPKKLGDTMSPNSLEELGISKKQSSRWQLAASLPEDDYQQIVERCNSLSKELTQSSVLAAARKLRDLLDPHEEAPEEETPVADLMELVGEVRTQVAKWAEQFGSDRLDILANVLKSEIASMEVSP